MHPSGKVGRLKCLVIRFCRRVIFDVIQLDQEYRAADATNTIRSFTQSAQRTNGSPLTLPLESFQQTETAGRNRTSRNEHHV